MRQKSVVGSRQDVGEAHLNTRSVQASLMPNADEDLRLIEGHPVGYAIGQLVNDNPGVLSEPVRAIIVEPAAAAVPPKFTFPR